MAVPCCARKSKTAAARCVILRAIDLPTLLNLITTGAVVIGVFFGLFELRQALANRREHKWIEAEGASIGSPNVGEWWQWLYERMEADPDPGKAAGAYVSFKGIDHR